MVFFQAALLGGYFYAHLIASKLSFRVQLALHAVVLIGVATFFLPIGLPHGPAWIPLAEDSPARWALMLAAAAVGAPFFILAATGPLLQSWFARTMHSKAKDPYFLYAASNAGSMLALLAYPLLLEPSLSLSSQQKTWSWMFALFATLAIACGVAVLKGSEKTEIKSISEPVTSRARLRWVVFALVPSSLLLATTQHLTTNIAPIPLLWVIPLAIYLAAFVVAFSGKAGAVAAKYCNGLAPLAALCIGAILLRETMVPIGPIIGVHLLFLVFGAVICLVRLFEERPTAAQLTGFYLWIGLGGVLGGVLNAFVLPHLFSNITEYPLIVALICFLRPAATPKQTKIKLAVAFVVTALLLVPLAEIKTSRRQLYAERTFFGVHRVYAVRSGSADWHELWDGRTLHGKQYQEPPWSLDPTTYYYKTGPIGDVMKMLQSRERAMKQVGLVGLGAGSLTAYGRAGEEFALFEIDPAVVRIAHDANLFTYLRDSKAKLRVVTGDARIKLQQEPDASFDLLALDAFSSDAIPVHLLTREAVALYMAKLADDGILAIHITNWYLNLEPVVSRSVSELGLHALIRSDFNITDQEGVFGKYGSVWIVVGRSHENLGALAANSQWLQLKPATSLRVWSDDYSDLMSVFKW